MLRILFSSSMSQPGRVFFIMFDIIFPVRQFGFESFRGVEQKHRARKKLFMKWRMKKCVLPFNFNIRERERLK